MKMKDTSAFVRVKDAARSLRADRSKCVHVMHNVPRNFAPLVHEISNYLKRHKISRCAMVDPGRLSNDIVQPTVQATGKYQTFLNFNVQTTIRSIIRINYFEHCLALALPLQLAKPKGEKPIHILPISLNYITELAAWLRASARSSLYLASLLHASEFHKYGHSCKEFLARVLLLNQLSCSARSKLETKKLNADRAELMLQWPIYKCALSHPQPSSRFFSTTS